jgi:two-component system sensor histidine kinase DesK
MGASSLNPEGDGKGERMERRGPLVSSDRFRPITMYVTSTYVILGVGTLVAPAVAFVMEPRSALVTSSAMLAAALVGVGASLLVAAEFAPHHRFTGWLRRSRATALTAAVVLLSAVVVATLVPDTGHSVTAAAVPLTWALRAVSGGSFWSGIVRLLIATVVVGLGMLVVVAASSQAWDQLTLVAAALIALGILVQDSIYALAIELDDLRSREAERAVMLERKRFAGDLHDIQGQHLSLIAVEAELVSRLIDRGDHSAAAEHAERVQAITLEALEEMYRVVHANREVRIDDEIANAVRVLQAAGITTQRDTAGLVGIDDDVDRLLGLTVREAVTNILKHTWATRCFITTRQESRGARIGIALLVTDSSDGTPPSTRAPNSGRSGTGLNTLRNRYRESGGEIEFTFEDGGRLQGWLPLGHRQERVEAR